MPKSPEEMAAAMIANLPEKTGKSLPEWLKITQAKSFEKHGQIMKFLKGEHGLTHGFANLIAQFTLKPQGFGGDGDELVATQYSGAKGGLRPIYDALLQQIEGFGSDVEIAPKKAYVSLRRSKQFGLIQPSTKTRVDVGINLKGTSPTERLEASGSFNSMVSHRVRLTSAEQVDDELIAWLKQAYEAS